MIEFRSAFSLHAGDQRLGGRERIALLEKIGETGSITAAAQAVGMSYKGAWDAIDAMNNLSDEPLVVRAAGGKHGGGTQLTARGAHMVQAFRQLEAEQRWFEQQRGKLDEASLRDIALMRRLMIRTSARNQFSGTVVAVHAGAVNDVVELEISGGARLVASITSESTRELGLAPGVGAIALIKASSVMLGLPSEGMRLSARNQLPGIVQAVHRGTVSADVRVDLHGGVVMAAVVTLDSVDALALEEGTAVLAIVKASSVILGTDG